MGHENTGSISVLALRADGYSPDGKKIIISLTTKYSTAERKYSVPIECFCDLIVDLQRLNAAPRAASAKPFIETDFGPNPADDANQLALAV